jgi:hypothetical protein
MRREKEQGFFFVKKKQKTFFRWGMGVEIAMDQINRSFLVLFYKKEHF